jgi:exopolysaccharide production protein ExoQ
MSPQIALLIYFILLLMLFWYDRKTETSVSRAIWLPTIWFMIISSRPVARWLAWGQSSAFEHEAMTSGSPIDRAVYTALIVLGSLVLLARRVEFRLLVKNNKWLFVLLLYCGLSTLWSDFFFIAFKRYIKSIGFIIMALIIVTDAKPMAAFEAVIRRTAYVLIPLSIILIKYFRVVGIGYSPWGGGPYYQGAGGNKNILGRLCFVAGIYFVWRLLHATRDVPMKTKLISIVFLVMSTWLLYKSDSVTSMASLFIAISLLMCLKLNAIKRNIYNFTWLAAGLLVVAVFTEYVANLSAHIITDLFDRELTLTGRTELWQDVIALMGNPVFGTGFESFWLGERLEILWEKYWWKPTMAHNAYLEVYLELGIVGLLLWVGVLLSKFRQAYRQLNHNYSFGALRLAFLTAFVFYNITEDGLGLMSFMWFVFLITQIDYSASAAYRPDYLPESYQSDSQHPAG